MSDIRTDWTREEILDIYNTPIMELIYRAGTVHRQYHDPNEVQVCTLLSIKTGGCPEDCAYCPQSARYNTGIEAEKLMDKDYVVEQARKAKEAGSTRFCMGAAWRDARKNKDFERVVEMVREITGMGMEVCCTLGMLTEEQAARLKEAGLYAYNHNLDTSERYYQEVVTTRSYQERLDTLENVRNHEISTCCGGIIGMGETDQDRVDLLHTLATMPEHPESVPVNALIAVPGTPMEDMEPVSVWEMVRMVATARIIMPRSMVRLSAGRVRFSESEQAMCFLAGANSIFAGEKLLTTENNDIDEDTRMFQNLNLKPRASFKNAKEKFVPEQHQSAEAGQA